MEKQDLIVTLVQSELYWHNVEANLGMFEEKIWSIGEKTHLIALPELFTTGFTMDVAQFAEPMNGRTFKWMKQQAAQTGAVMTGSYIVREKDAYYNRLVWMEPDGSFSWYDKRHLFRMGDEHHYYSAGKTLLIKNLNGWKICPLVCYDLRFPVWSRNTTNDQNELAYDVLLFVANWPESRINAWDTLLQARALENLCYVIGVNRIGKDGADVKYNGHSTVVNPKGRKMFSTNEEKEIIRTISLDYQRLSGFREKFPAHLDADRFRIEE